MQNKVTRKSGSVVSITAALADHTILGVNGSVPSEIRTARLRRGFYWLIPGLDNLACEGCMSSEFEVLGIGHTPMSSEKCRKKTGEAAAKSKDTREFSESDYLVGAGDFHRLDVPDGSNSRRMPRPPMPGRA